MRKIIRQRELVADAWRYAGEAGDGPLVQPLAEFLAAVAAGTAPAQGAGVRLAPTDALEQLGPELGRVALVVVDFPKNGDGRGFTQGQLLRQRHRYGGELRATGVVLVDHMFYLARCGFDAFELAAGVDPQAALAALHSFSVAYQGASDAGVLTRGRRFA
ncbi:MAG: DUF934 domain-containing protein [Steroidobacteraceae bacterium]